MKQRTIITEEVTSKTEEPQASERDLLSLFKQTVPLILTNVKVNTFPVVVLPGVTAYPFSQHQPQVFDSNTNPSLAIGYEMLEGFIFTAAACLLTDSYDIDGIIKLYFPAPQKPLPNINELIRNLFELAMEQNFENGMQSNFSRNLNLMVQKYGGLAIKETSDLIINDKVNHDISSEALRWLGRMKHPETYSWRSWLLKRCLTCYSPLVRDGAALGLASLHDTSAIPDLKEAINQETIVELHDDLQQVLDELEASLNATSFKKNT